MKYSLLVLYCCIINNIEKFKLSTDACEAEVLVVAAVDDGVLMGSADCSFRK